MCWWWCPASTTAAPAGRCPIENLQFSHIKICWSFSALFTPFKKSEGCEPIVFLPHSLGSKSTFTFFFYGWKNCARGECLNIRKFFMELNWMTITNLSCVPVWLHIFSAQRARKEKCSVCLDNPWRHSSYVGCSLEHFDMDVCVYSTLMAELLQNDEWPGIYNYNRCNAINHHLGAVFHR